MGKSCAIDLRVADSNPAGQLLIYFHNVYPVLTKTLCRHSSPVPRSRIKAFVRKPLVLRKTQHSGNQAVWNCIPVNGSLETNYT